MSPQESFQYLSECQFSFWNWKEYPPENIVTSSEILKIDLNPISFDAVFKMSCLLVDIAEDVIDLTSCSVNDLSLY